MPEPRAQHRHDHDVRRTRGALRPAPSGVCTVTGEAGRSRVASAASSRLMRTAIRRNSSGGVARIAQRHERIVHERVLDEMDTDTAVTISMPVADLAQCERSAESRGRGAGARRV